MAQNLIQSDPSAFTLSGEFQWQKRTKIENLPLRRKLKRRGIRSQRRNRSGYPRFLQNSNSTTLDYGEGKARMRHVLEAHGFPAHFRSDGRDIWW